MLPPSHLSTHYQQKTDSDHLRILSIFHFVFGGLAILGIGFLILHYTLMTHVLNLARHQPQGPQIPQEFFKMIIGFYWIGGGVLLVAGIANILSGLFIYQRKHRIFSIVVAGINCIQLPIGTVLGIFTIVVLSRDSVRGIYETDRI